MNKTVFKALFGLLLLVSFSNSNASIFMKIEGITGTSTAKGHEGWVVLDSASFNASNINDKVVFAPLVISKQTDVATPALNMEVFLGNAKKVEIHFVTVGVDTLDTYMTYLLKGAKLISVETNSNGNRPVEVYKIIFDSITGTFTPYSDQGRPMTPIPFGYDLVSGTQL